MNGTAEVFESHRSRLFGVAYRMLGTRSDAEDILQEAYLRWHHSASDDIQSPVAFLVTITTRLCLDRLRSLKQEREQYIGPWLPEPIVDELTPSPEEQYEFAEEISVAFLAMLERLGPEERAAFLLHEVFDYDYAEVAQIIGKSEPACRQMISRARPKLRESQQRHAISVESRQRMLEKFLAATKSGNREAIMALLAEDVEHVSDGGGKALATLKVLYGPDRIGRLYYCLARRLAGVTYRPVMVNGELGLVGLHEGKIFSVITLLTDGERISGIYVIRNPDKLAGVKLDKLDH